MLCKNIMDVIEHTYPKTAAMEWDNVGLLVGRAEKEVRKIYVALDATDEVVEAAISAGADMLITHHPLIFSPMKQITDTDFIGSRAVKLLQHDISYYAMHTNSDVLGMADLAAEMLGLTNTEVLEEIGIGRVGELPAEMTVRQLCELVKERFGLESVKLFGSPQHPVSRVAISPGSGKHMSELAIAKGAQVFITGDIDHHEGLDAVEQGMAIVDAGHYGLEHIFIEDMANYLSEHLAGVEVEKAEICHPYSIL